MALDRYNSFDELRRHEREGIDFRICVTQRGPPGAVIAPHGGKIEPATSEITAAIAGALYISYYFEGLRSRPHSHLHITSTKFDVRPSRPAGGFFTTSTPGGDCTGGGDTKPK